MFWETSKPIAPKKPTPMSPLAIALLLKLHSDDELSAKSAAGRETPDHPQ